MTSMMKQNPLVSAINPDYENIQLSLQYIRVILLQVFTGYELKLQEEVPTDENRATLEFYGNKPYANNKT